MIFDEIFEVNSPIERSLKFAAKLLLKVESTASFLVCEMWCF